MTRLCCLICLSAFTAIACGGAAPDEIETAAVVPVVTATAEVATIRAVIRATGVIAPAPGGDLTITASEPARILEMPKAEGDHVKVGDLLLRLDVPTATSNVAAAETGTAQAKARVANARAASQRAHDLFDRGVGARKEMEDADRDLADATAAVTQAEAAVTAATALAARTTWRATFDGVVAKRAHNPGDFVDGSSSDVILRIIDPRRLEVVASVSVADIARLSVGAAAQLVDRSRGDGAALRVLTRPAAIEPGAATGTVRLAFVKPASYAAGTSVEVSIDGEQRRGIVVPSAALVHDGDETAVFVVEGGKAHRKVIETGVTDDTRVEVRSGLTAGAAVIVQGQAGLPDETPVSVGQAGGKAEKEEK